jgi:RNA polymerase sigma-70 factor (ECF subfamily)
MQDVELLDRFHAGDSEAFAVLLGRYERSVYNFLLRSARDARAAEDLTQDVFMRVIQGSREFNRTAKFSTWLFTIARHLCIDHSRRMKHRRHASLDGQAADTEDGPGGQLLDRIANGEPGVDRRADSEQMRARIARAVEALPDEQREVFLLRHTQNMPFAEIAEICGVPENTVKSRMRYALERLQAALAEYQEYAQALG